MNNLKEHSFSHANEYDFMLDILKDFLARARNIIGSEETYRAILVNQLRQSGIQFDNIIAEHPTTSGRIDLALFVRDAAGERISHLIEIKGGAYGNRHALHDELKPGLETRDLKKLEETGDSNSRRWFIALDISSIKGPIDTDTRSWVASECAQRNIDFVYYDFASSEAEVTSTGVHISLPIEDQTPNCRMNPAAAAILGSDLFWERARKISNSAGRHEQNQVLRIYETLMQHAFPDYAVSLETQFQFARGSSKNGKNRPDLCIFDPTINGKFNLYAQGKPAQSRDALKLLKLQQLIEVKVSPSIGDALDDIKKLAGWRTQMTSRASELGVELSRQVGFMFVAAQMDSRIIPEVTTFAQNMDIAVRII